MNQNTLLKLQIKIGVHLINVELSQLPTLFVHIELRIGTSIYLGKIDLLVQIFLLPNVYFKSWGLTQKF